MQVVWQTFLEAVNPGGVISAPGTRQLCPVHAKAGGGHNRTLAVTTDPVTGEPYFVCHHTRCHFRGTAVTVVQQLHELTRFEDAVAYFKPGKPYAHTLAPNLGPDYLAAYIEQNNASVRMTHWVNRCRIRMRTVSRASTAIRSALEDLGCIEAPTDICVIHGAAANSRNKDIPEDIARRCTDANYIMYPYTHNYRLHAIRFQKIHTIEAWCTPETHLLTPTDTGVFMEDNISNADTHVYIVPTALGACVVYSKCRTHTLKSLPIVSVAGFPLPLTFHRIKQITIITFNQAPLDLGPALELYNTSVLEDGTDRPVRVIDLNLNYDQLPCDLYTRLEAREYHSLTLEDWLIHKMRRLESRNSHETITKVFDRIILTADRQAALLARAKSTDLSGNTLNVIAHATGTDAYNRLTLANQRSLSLTAAGLKAVNPNGDVEILCNFNITVDAKTRLDKGRVGYKCTITLDNHSFTVGLTDRDLRSAETLRSAITATMTALGITGYIAVYKVKHYDWQDILCKLGQDVSCDINA